MRIQPKNPESSWVQRRYRSVMLNWCSTLLKLLNGKCRIQGFLSIFESKCLDISTSAFLNKTYYYVPHLLYLCAVFVQHLTVFTVFLFFLKDVTCLTICGVPQIARAWTAMRMWTWWPNHLSLQLSERRKPWGKYYICMLTAVIILNINHAGYYRLFLRGFSLVFPLTIIL